MRALKYLIPQHVHDSLNANPTFQWVVSILLVGIGVLFVVKGIDGFKNKRLTGKRGRVFEGTTAQVLGLVWIALGGLLAVITVGMRVLALL